MLGSLVILVLGAGTLVAVQDVRGERPRRQPAPPESPARPVPEVSFKLEHVKRITTVANTREDEVDRVAREVRAVVERLYAAGFVDPARWRGGAFPEVLELFAVRAGRHARRDLGHLTLGGDASHVVLVRPTRERLRVTLLIGTERAPVAAVAHTRFRAEAELADGGALHIVHRGEYTMRPEAGAWRIVGYRVRGNLSSGSAAGGDSS
ncbi:MAG: hypothetical protein M3245_05320 [Actinomycetota bacterium]|nr:hypothetical protein [Actinomycetota bacterium]